MAGLREPRPGVRQHISQLRRGRKGGLELGVWRGDGGGKGLYLCILIRWRCQLGRDKHVNTR